VPGYTKSKTTAESKKPYKRKNESNFSICSLKFGLHFSLRNATYQHYYSMAILFQFFAFQTYFRQLTMKTNVAMKSTTNKRCFYDFEEVDKVQLINAGKIKIAHVYKYKNSLHNITADFQRGKRTNVTILIRFQCKLGFKAWLPSERNDREIKNSI